MNFIQQFKVIAKWVYHKIWQKLVYRLKLELYWLRVPFLVRRIRKKQSIRVLFVISEVASWKSELLYRAMLTHPRFDPFLGVSTSRAPWGVKNSVISYVLKKGYDYFDLDKEGQDIDTVHPDIIIYYKPYSSCYSEGHFFNNYLRYLFCGMDYCFEATKHAVHIEKELFDFCWQFYVEHPEIVCRRKEILGFRARNTLLTGVPMQDVLMMPKERFEDPWRDKTGKKRIIYAPHHSIVGTNGEGIEFATFLEYGEYILELAKKYNSTVSIAFKPHPNLYMKLLKIWGQQKTDSFYEEWEKLPNTQLEKGEYVGLFKFSDAIIHDCASFIIEYLYMNKPGLYLTAETNNMGDMFDFVKEGYQCYEHCNNRQEIELFIQRVIQGKDLLKESRQEFFQSQLVPPGERTACDNIMNAILKG